MSAPRIYDYDAILAQFASDPSASRAAARFGAAVSTVTRVRDLAAGRQPVRRAVAPCLQRLAALGVDGRDPVRAARAAALSERIRRLHADARAGGALLCGSLQIAAAHAAGLTLEDIEQVFAVTPAEAARAIAAHAGRC